MQYLVTSRRDPRDGTSDHLLFVVHDDNQFTLFERTIERHALHAEHRATTARLPLAELGRILAARGLPGAVPYGLTIGEYVPRVWRGHENPTRHQADLEAAETSTRRVVLDLCARLDRVFWYTEPDPRVQAFGHELRALLILACTEVESAWKSILRASNYPGERLTTHDYVKLFAPMRLAEWKVQLRQHSSWGHIAPFAGWSSTAPTDSLEWYSAYNAAKHGRETNLHRATLKAAIEAVAAAYVLMVAQFGWLIRAEQVLGIPLDEPLQVFELREQPDWPASEEYIAPIQHEGSWLGREKWTATALRGL